MPYVTSPVIPVTATVRERPHTVIPSRCKFPGNIFIVHAQSLLPKVSSHLARHATCLGIIRAAFIGYLYAQDILRTSLPGLDRAPYDAIPS